MKIYDISLPISPDMVVWLQTQPVALYRVSDQANGAPATVSSLHVEVHTGTHIDAPLHFLQGGKTIETVSLDILCGEALVCAAPAVDVISADVLEGLGIPQNTERLLLRTRNSELWKQSYSAAFRFDYVGIDPSGAQWLVQRGVKAVGIDYLSIASYADLKPTHEILLGAGIIPIEGLDLSQVEPGMYMLYCLPLNLLGSDGAPARAILVKDD
jgi:arylformamidase